MSETIKQQCGDVAACCCMDVGTIMDNTDCSAAYSAVFSQESEANNALEALIQKARSVESEPCQITSQISKVANGYQLDANFNFACQAETLIFQLGLR